jgi:hypothetical protein
VMEKAAGWWLRILTLLGQSAFLGAPFRAREVACREPLRGGDVRFVFLDKIVDKRAFPILST